LGPAGSATRSVERTTPASPSAKLRRASIPPAASLIAGSRRRAASALARRRRPGRHISSIIAGTSASSSHAAGGPRPSNRTPLACSTLMICAEPALPRRRDDGLSPKPWDRTARPSSSVASTDAPRSSSSRSVNFAFLFTTRRIARLGARSAPRLAGYFATGRSTHSGEAQAWALRWRSW
jgi:hypothetical protein